MVARKKTHCMFRSDTDLSKEHIYPLISLSGHQRSFSAVSHFRARLGPSRHVRFPPDRYQKADILNWPLVPTTG